MLLSLVSKRSLEVDSRDGYGFALRPQHLQRYQEYVSIYTEEETERAEKWKIFLDRLDVPVESCSSEDEFQDTTQAESQESEEESASGKVSSNGKHDSDYFSDRELDITEVNHLEHDNPQTVDELSKEREPDKEAQVRQYLRDGSLGRSSEPVKDDEKQFESAKEEENEKELSAKESESDEEEQFHSVKEPVEKENEKEVSVKQSESDEEEQSQSIKEHVEKENEKEKEFSVKQSESDEEKQSQSVKEPVEKEKEKEKEKDFSAKQSEPDKEEQSQLIKETVEKENVKELSVKQSESDEEEQSKSVKEPGEKENEKEFSAKQSESDEEEQSQSVKEPVEKENEKEFQVKQSEYDEEEQFQSVKESVEKENEKESESDEEEQTKSVKEIVNNLHLQQEDATEKLVVEADKCESEHDKQKKETKARSVVEWAQIRPCLASIEAMMCTRVKNVKYMKNRQSTLVGDHASTIKEKLPSIGESEQNSGEDEHDREASTERYPSIKEGNDGQNSVSPEPFWYEELEVLVRLGVPKDLRGEVWQAFVGVKARRVERYYQDLLAQITKSDEDTEHQSSTDIQRKWKKQIEKDIPRTFPGHPALNDNGRDSLRRILLAYACHNPSVGYCQAMNFFAGLLLLLMPEENAFWTLVGVIDDYFCGYYTEEMIESQVDQLVFEELMRERFPKLVNHLDYLGVQVAWISGPWFLSIFVNILPWDCVLRMWDVLLFEGNRVVLFRTAFALMELYGPAIVATKDAGDAITSLQTLASSTFDSSQLVLTACMGYLSTNEARLEELRARHRPAVLEIVDERIHKGRVWKDKKGLASKLYSFKHEGSILDEQKSTQRTDGENPNDKDSLDPDVDSQLDSLPDLQEQVVWMKVELCRLLEEKRSALLRADELEIALMEMVKEDNRLELTARIEQLEKEVKELKQFLSDKKEQEAAMLQLLMKVEQDQKLTEDARLNAEQDAAEQKLATHVLQEKNEQLMTQLAQMEKRLVTAETTLEATLQYESGQNKAISSPRATRTLVSDSPKKRTGFLSFGLGWRDRNKAKQSEESNGDNTSNATSEANSPSKESVSRQESNLSKESVSRQGSNLSIESISRQGSNLSKESKSEDLGDKTLITDKES